jgi:hypothetical protein
MGELVARFVLGGLIVTVFAVIGQLVKPKSFSGIFSGAPSVALATLGLTFSTRGGAYAATEARSMLIGAAALAVYSVVTGVLVLRNRFPPIVVAPLSWAAWLVVALGLWWVFLA